MKVLEIKKEHIDAAIEWDINHRDECGITGNCVIARALIGAGYSNPNVGFTTASASRDGRRYKFFFKDTNTVMKITRDYKAWPWLQPTSLECELAYWHEEDL